MDRDRYKELRGVEKKTSWKAQGYQVHGKKWQDRAGSSKPVMNGYQFTILLALANESIMEIIADLKD
jgi:hypothetical protein